MKGVAALVLAAGASRRLGQPKQLVLLGGERLIERAVRIAQEAGLDPVIVVLGCGAETIQKTCSLNGAQVLVNAEWAEGMGASMRAGIVALPEGLAGAIVMTCDQPAVTAGHLRELARLGKELAASAYGGRRGVPAYFPAASFERLLTLRGDQGARELVCDARAVELAGGGLDIDTVETLAEARQIYG